MKRLTTAILLVCLANVQLWASSDSTDDFMRNMGKMYVVVGVIVAVFVGIIAYLIRLDRKLTKLEHQIRTNE